MSFSSDLRRWARQTQQSIDRVVQQAVLLAAQGLILRSPVGNPELWAANAGKSPGDPGYVGQGYVGGRFRANWTFGVGTPDTETTDETDQSGGATLQAIAAAVSGQPAGHVYYITNSLPYARPLEYGHSTQAPAGMARVTFAELPGYLEQYMASLTQ